MKRNKELKDMSVYEASDYWDEHDFGEFNDIEEVKDLKFSLRKKKYVGIDVKLYSLIRRKAQSLRKTEENLIHEWLQDRVKT